MTKVGIVTALRAEAACLTSNKLVPMVPVYLHEPLVLILSGMGSNSVNAAINTLLSEGVEGLISFGTAAALSPELKSGDIVIPGNIITSNGETLAISSRWRDKVLQQMSKAPATVHDGNMAGTNTVIASTEDKRTLGEKSTALAVDMESALITAAALHHGLASLTVRIIVDEANMTIPDRILTHTDAFGQVAIPALLGDLLLHPTLIRDLLVLGQAFRAASHSMRWIGRHAELIFSSK